jgi:hypothetical protein
MDSGHFGFAQYKQLKVDSGQLNDLQGLEVEPGDGGPVHLASGGDGVDILGIALAQNRGVPIGGMDGDCPGGEGVDSFGHGRSG